MANSEHVSLDHVQFDASGRAIISHPETVARLRCACLREEVGSSDRRANPQGISRIRSLTFPSPILVRGTRPSAHDPSLATAMLRFGPRRLLSLGSILDADTPADIRRQIEASDFAGQPGFAAKPYACALRESTNVTRHVLGKLSAACADLFGPEFDENHLIVAVAVRQKEGYTQLQGAHIDWTKGAEFRDDEWQYPHWVGQGTNTLRSLEFRHSIDCVLGGPPTEFFLDEQTATIHLQANDDGRWIVSTIEFTDLGTPRPGLCGEAVFRPGYTIHQFPSAASWTSASEQRLFVSCDYYSALLSEGMSE